MELRAGACTSVSVDVVQGKGLSSGVSADQAVPKTLRARLAVVGGDTSNVMLNGSGDFFAFDKTWAPC